jgi:hypothetical protein
LKAGALVGAPMALVLAMVALPVAAQADQMNVVNCDGFDITYDAPGAKQTCYDLDVSGNQTDAEYKRLTSQAANYELTLTYAVGKFRTYFPMRSLREQIEDAAYFADTDDWLGVKKFGGFEVAVFDGFQSAGSKPTLCAAFSRYSGNMSGQYEYPGGPGFPHHALGLYCVFADQQALLNPPDNFYRVVEEAIGRLHLPQ